MLAPYQTGFRIRQRVPTGDSQPYLPTVHTSRPVTEYLLLGLRFGRLDRELVESFTGDPRLPRRVAAEPRPDPGQLAAAARRLRDELLAVPRAGGNDGELSARRTAYLAAQLTALEHAGRRMAGGGAGALEDVAAACFQVRPRGGELDHYRRVHAELSAALPGRGTAAERLDRLRAAEQVSPEDTPRAVRALSAALRRRARAEIGLPVQESVSYLFVRSGRWSGMQRYQGDFRSLVGIDALRERWAGRLAALVAHEAYPGHHVESCRRQCELVDRLDHQEHAIALRDTPQSLISEGFAELGPGVLGPGWGPLVADALADVGVRLDGALAERVHGLLGELAGVRWDAARMLHERPGDPDRAVLHLRRWALMPEPRARGLVGYLADPQRRARLAAYVEGRRLVAGWLAAEPGSPGRLRRLLDEPWTPAALARGAGRSDAGTVRGGD